MKVKSFFGIAIIYSLALSGCIDFADEPFEPFNPRAQVFVFTQSNGFIDYEGYQGISLNNDTQNDIFPFEVDVFSSGDSLIQELRHQPSAKIMASGYALPESNSPGKLYKLDSYSGYFEYYDESYRAPTRPEFEQLEILGPPISEEEVDLPYMWRQMVKNPYFKRHMSSVNARISLTRFKPFSDSDELSGSTFVFITYTY